MKLLHTALLAAAVSSAGASIDGSLRGTVRRLYCSFMGDDCCVIPSGGCSCVPAVCHPNSANRVGAGAITSYTVKTVNKDGTVVKETTVPGGKGPTEPPIPPDGSVNKADGDGDPQALGDSEDVGGNDPEDPCDANIPSIGTPGALPKHCTMCCQCQSNICIRSSNQNGVTKGLCHDEIQKGFELVDNCS